MDFKKQIILSVKDRASRVLNKVNRVSEKIDRTTRRMSRSNSALARTLGTVGNAINRAARATASWARRAQIVRRTFSGLGRTIGRVAKAAALALPAGLSAAGIGVAGTSKSLARENATATSVGTDVNTFRLLREFLVRQSGGALDSDGAESLLKDLAERQQEVRAEIARAVAEGKNPDEAGGAAIDAFKSLGILEAQNLPLQKLLEELLSAAKSSENATFIGREILSEEGTFLPKLASGTKAEAEKLLSEIQASLPQIDQAAVENAENFNNALSDMRLQLQNLSLKVLTPLTPILENIVSSISQKLGGIDGEQVSMKITSIADSIESFYNRISAIADGIQQALAKLGLAEKSMQTLAKEDAKRRAVESKIARDAQAIGINVKPNQTSGLADATANEVGASMEGLKLAQEAQRAAAERAAQASEQTATATATSNTLLQGVITAISGIRAAPQRQIGPGGTGAEDATPDGGP